MGKNHNVIEDDGGATRSVLATHTVEPALPNFSAVVVKCHQYRLFRSRPERVDVVGIGGRCGGGVAIKLAHTVPGKHVSLLP